MITLAKDAMPLNKRDLGDFKGIIETSQEIMRSIQSLNGISIGLVENYNETICLFKSRFPNETVETLLEKILADTLEGLS